MFRRRLEAVEAGDEAGQEARVKSIKGQEDTQARCLRARPAGWHEVIGFRGLVTTWSWGFQEAEGLRVSWL
jgi:hypothetical protein